VRELLSEELCEDNVSNQEDRSKKKLRQVQAYNIKRREMQNLEGRGKKDVRTRGGRAHAEVAVHCLRLLSDLLG
jgi:hypothetical protein